MPYSLGIDAGGTNTDAVIYDIDNDRLIACAKIPTNHQDYGHSVREVFQKLFVNTEIDKRQIIMVNLSTTLSTNAILEGKTELVNLILIGYEKRTNIVRRVIDSQILSSVLFVQGGHTSWGEPVAELDIKRIRSYAQEHRGEIFAVSGIFSPRNPEHEIFTRRILEDVGCLAVSCGYELGHAKLNAVKRTITTYLNASLVPIIGQFIDETEIVLRNSTLDCPIMFLKSDGTLISAEWCRKYPIETVFSGPAASLCGACYLVRDYKNENMLIADIGGTSTDIGKVVYGHPIFSREGATIGSYRTMIPSLEIRSIALGGDSAVEIREGQRIEIGPCRVTPVCCSSEKTDVCGYTPTDAMNTLGKSNIGVKSLSWEVSESLGNRLALSGAKFAELVWKNASETLEKHLKYVEKGESCLRVYIGAPGQVFAKSSQACRVAEIANEIASVASAIGTATSSVRLKCEAMIVHSFEDETYSAFLPHKRFSSTVLQWILDETEQEVSHYLEFLASEMGIAESVMFLERQYSYLGKKETDSAITSIKIMAKLLHGTKSV